MRDPTVSVKILRFGRCEIRIGSREVFIDGVAISLGPRMYELLAYLIENRVRVLTKDELLSSVWPTTEIFEGALAKAVMMIRKTFRDAGDDSTFIRTVHRIGYQFVANVEVIEDTIGADGRSLRSRKALTSMTGHRRLALLPFQNHTGDDGMSWIELGLMAMAGKVIAAGGGVLVASPQETMLAVAGLAPNASFDARVHAVERVTGIRDVASVKVSGSDGNYELHWTLRTSRGDTMSGVVSGTEITRMALELAEEVAEATRAPEQAPLASAFAVGDEFENQAFARALQAIEEERFRSALNLLHLCAEVTPHPVEVDLEYLHVLSEMSDRRTEAHAARLLKQLGATPNPAHKARVLVSLAEYMFRSNETSQKAEHYAEEARRLLSAQGPSELLVRVTVLRARIAIVSRAFAHARAMLNQALSYADRLGNSLLLAKTMVHVGMVEASEGNLPAAIACFERAVDLSRRSNLYANLANCLANLSLALSRSGRYARAHEVADEALAISRQGGAPGLLATVMRVICVNCMVRGRYAEAESILNGMDTSELNQISLGRGYLHYLRATLAMARENLVDAADEFALAEPLLRKYPYPWLNFILPSRIDLAIRTGALDEALELTGEYEHHPHFARDLRLQACAHLARGLIAAARGQRREAIEHMRAGLEVSPPDEIYAQIAGRAVWYHLDEGDVASAEKLLSLITPWVEENPAALAVRARVAAATGDYKAALRDQDQCIALLGDHVPAHIHALREAYAAAADTEEALSLPPAAQFLRPF